MNRLRKGDSVVIISGKESGSKGVVTSILSNRDRVVVEGINFVTKHVKPNPNKGIQGGTIKKEASVHISNVALYNPTTKKADRVGFKFLKDGSKKVRYFKSNGEILDL